MTTVLVTGANRGIGLELVRHYLSEGAKVHACCRTPSEAQELNALEGNVTVHELDTTDFGRMDALAAGIDEPIDIVIANAGIYGDKPQDFDKIEAGGLLRTLEVNIVGTVRTLQSFLPHLRKSQGKKLVAISSKMGSIADASAGSLAYRTSKCGLNMAMCMAAAELEGEGIAVGTLHPGWVRTDMGGPNGNISPEESARGLAAVIARLKPSPKAPFLAHDGQEIPW